MSSHREKTRQISVGGVPVGGGAPVTVQSMTNTKTKDAEATAAQIARLKEAGCDIVRVAVPDAESAEAIGGIKRLCRMPVVADIHFDHRLAIASVKAGADKIRINPGNIGGADKLREVAAACRDRGAPIRVGVNAGSLDKRFLHNGKITAKSLVDSAVNELEQLSGVAFNDVCVSLKASDVMLCVEAYRLFAERSDMPLHLGITEAGTRHAGIIRSAAGLGALLLDGIGDTIRVSLTADPVEEIRAGIELLKAVGIRKGGVRFISCPGCARRGMDVYAAAEKVEDALRDLERDITVAVMGCVVNGPGEAKGADYAVCGGGNGAMLYKNGEKLRKIPPSVDPADALIELILNDR